MKVTGWGPAAARGLQQFVSAAVVLALIATAAVAGGAVTIEPDRQFALAESLFADREFSGAVIEYRRFIHFFPDDPRVDAAMYRVGRSLFNQGLYPKAIDAFYDLIDRYPTGPWTVQAYQGIAASHLRNNTPGQAVAVLEQLIAATDSPDVADDANYRIGWIYLDLADWERSREYFNRVGPENRVAFRIGHLENRLDQVPDLPRKNPTTAGLLALLPGAGHFYCGRYRDGLISLAVNAAFIVAAVESFNNDLPVLGGVISAVGLGFYTGNIYSAVGSAHKYNRNQERAFIESLKKDARPTLTLGASANGVMASLQIVF